MLQQGLDWGWGQLTTVSDQGLIGRSLAAGPSSHNVNVHLLSLFRVSAGGGKNKKLFVALRPFQPTNLNLSSVFFFF